MTQEQLDSMAREASNDYASKIVKAPFKQSRILGVQIESAWQVERRFVENVRRVQQIATAFGLSNPFDGLEVEEPKEPGMFDEG